MLKIEDGGETVTVWDSLAICETLAERHPEAQLWPEDWAARALARSYAAEMHSGFPDLRDQLSMDFARRIAAAGTCAPTPKARSRALWPAWEDALTRYGGKDGFLFGNFSIADCMYAPVVSRFHHLSTSRCRSRSRTIWTRSGRCRHAGLAEGFAERSRGRNCLDASAARCATLRRRNAPRRDAAARAASAPPC